MPNTPYGQTVIPRLTFKDRDGALVDVTGITVEIEPPISPPYAVTGLGNFDHPSVGIYEGPQIATDEPGVWRGEAIGSIAGDGQAVALFHFCVDPDYVDAGAS